MDRGRIIQQILTGPTIVYQPIVNLWTGTTVGYEALSRFPDADPEVYFTAAKEHGLGQELELASIRRAVATFRESGLHGYLSVNASPALAQSHPLCNELEGIPGGTQIEITEADPVTNYRPLVRTLARARRKGSTLAIDDVGAGFAAMRHIINLHPDVLKIDRELVSGLHYIEETARRAVLSAYTHLAARQQTELVAEGIESNEEVFALRALGINYGQGYYFAKPQPARDLATRERRN